ncbi:MAG: DUF2141 domain-containing protein [Bacteroidales bacterium]|nr:DUF2141 domain-containing protein [Bacteroidales bacterium]
MKHLVICTLLLCCCYSHSLFSQSPETGTLEIRFTGLRSEKGSIAIGINTSPEGWPRKPQIDLNWKKENLKDGVFIVQVPDLPYGTLAVSVLDDENSNLKMDMTLGIPREGYGFSNDAPVRLSPPKYDASSFQFTRSNQQISIRLKYTGKGK